MPATQTPGNDTEMRTTDVGIDDDNEEHHGIQIGGFGTYKRENLYVIAGRSHEHLWIQAISEELKSMALNNVWKN